MTAVRSAAAPEVGHPAATWSAVLRSRPSAGAAVSAPAARVAGPAAGQRPTTVPTVLTRTPRQEPEQVDAVPRSSDVDRPEAVGPED
ncbi:hypothetical protein TOK_6224 [Pseudonocardia sp. N23]|nr:hypothetical protein TOK_6224 [Pseudonocardia sp. N23]